jgi:TusA-related sulfurtransferase
MEGMKLYKSIDATSSSCTGPIGELSGAMNDAYAGESVEIIVSDEATRNDVLTWAGKTGNKVVADRSEDGKYRIVIEKVR